MNSNGHQPEFISESNNLIAELERLHQSNQPDAAFAAELEILLRSHHRMIYAEGAGLMNVSRRVSLWKLAAASLILVFALFLTLEPLRSMAQDAWAFFTQHDSDEIDLPIKATGDEIYDGLTLAEVEGQSGFDVLEWHDPGYELAHVSYNATQQIVNLVYEPVGPDLAGSDLIFFTQKYVGDSALTLNEFDAVAPGAVIEHVNVRGVMGEFVRGYWSGTDPEQPAHMVWDESFLQLRWREGEFVYQMLTLGENINSSAALIQIADALG